MELNEEDVLKILELAEQSRFDEVIVEVGDVKIHCKNAVDAHDDAVSQPPSAQPPAIVQQPQPQAQAPTTSTSFHASAEQNRTESDADLVAVVAPMLGTFYRSSSPDSDPFVEVGSSVDVDDTVCLVEVMKLFNSVRAGSVGKIAKILVEDGALVEFGQPIMLIEPATA